MAWVWRPGWRWGAGSEMPSLRLQWRPFAFVLPQPLTTARGVLTHKRGWLLRLEGPAGQWGWGEAAPLELAGPGPWQALAAAIEQLPPELSRAQLDGLLASPRCPPCLGFALGAALAELDGLVGPEGWLAAPPSARLLPAGAAMPAALERVLAERQEAGMGEDPLCLKWKVAAAPDRWERQGLELLLQRLPAAARLRLDANGGWDRPTALAWAERLAAEPRLEWLEQPLAASDQEGLEPLAARVPLALDESLQADPSLRASWPGWQVRRPSQEGDPRPLLAALQAGRPRLMLSTAFETGIGRRWLEHLAGLQALGPTPAAPGLAPGWLPEGPLFAADPQLVWRGCHGARQPVLNPVDWPALQQRWAAGAWVVLAGPGEHPPELPAAALLPPGPGVVVGSGGSTGGRRWCLQPLAHLQASARATGAWLAQQGLDPAACLHLNPLPLHHVSGLLPQVRAAQWGCEHRAIAPELMRDPVALAAALPIPPARSVLLSLVPTQLRRLLAAPEGVAWLRQLAVIWVGGAALPPELAAQARREGLRLAPCYGATETAAMVTALTPQAFLAGVDGCGPPLGDVELRLDPASGAVELRTARLSPGFLERGRMVPLARSADGWWVSGDAGELSAAGLRILGRLDGAISSGGETVFPEQLEARLLAQAQAQAQALPLEALLLLPEPDPEWGQRLVALVRARADACGDGLIAALQQQVAGWAPAERPRRWIQCPNLAPTTTGKWQRSHWQAWVRSLEAGGSARGCDEPHQ